MKSSSNSRIRHPGGGAAKRPSIWRKLRTSIWHARLLSLLVGIGAFALFAATLHDGIFPGDSAHQVAAALRLEPYEVRTSTMRVEAARPQSGMSTEAVTTFELEQYTTTYHTRHVMWRAVSSMAAALPFFDIAFRMNMLSALFGALAVACAFGLARGLFLFLSFHLSRLAAGRRKHAAAISGLAGAIALATAPAFWISATRCLPDTFEILVFLAMGLLLLRATVEGHELPLVVFGVLFGLSVFETNIGVMMFPVLAFITYRALLIGGMNDARGWGNVILGFVFGIAVYLVAACIQPLRGGTSFIEPLSEFAKTLQDIGNVVFGGAMFEEQARLITLCLAVIPFLSMIAMAVFRDNDEASSSGGIMLLALTCTFTISVSGISISPWGSYRLDGSKYLPSFIALLNAAVGAYVVGQGMTFAGGGLFAKKGSRKRFRADEADDLVDVTQVSANRDYGVGRLLTWYVLAVSIFCAGWNYSHDVCDWRDGLIGKSAKGLVSSLDNHSWMVSGNPHFTTMARIFAFESGRRLSVINTANEKTTADRLSIAITRDKAFSGLQTDVLRSSINETNAFSFVSAWLRIDPHVGSKLVLESDDMSEEAERRLVPFYVGYVAEDGETDWVGLADGHLDFWRSLSGEPPIGAHAPVWLRRDRAAIRARMAKVGRQLAQDLVDNSFAFKAQSVLDAVNEVSDEPKVRESTFSGDYRFGF